MVANCLGGQICIVFATRIAVIVDGLLTNYR